MAALSAEVGWAIEAIPVDFDELHPDALIAAYTMAVRNLEGKADRIPMGLQWSLAESGIEGVDVYATDGAGVCVSMRYHHFVLRVPVIW